MQRMCRKVSAPAWRRRQLAVTEVLRHARVMRDPSKLAYLNAKVANRKAKTESDASGRKK
jgi:hypothetical protein